MKKEIIFVIAVCLFLLSYALDYFAGPLQFSVTSPIVFLTPKFFNLYPMTFVSVIVRSSALFISIGLILSLMEKQYIKKIIISLFLTFVAEIYAFQQLATGARTTPVLWTLAISYSGAALILLIVFYIFAGITNFLIPSHKGEVQLEKPESQSSDSSILNP